MSLLAVLDIRFGDPITAIALNEKSLIHGSMMGRIVYYSFTHSKEYQINEISEELIRCVHTHIYIYIYISIYIYLDKSIRRREEFFRFSG